MRYRGGTLCLQLQRSYRDSFSRNGFKFCNSAASLYIYHFIEWVPSNIALMARRLATGKINGARRWTVLKFSGHVIHVTWSVSRWVDSWDENREARDKELTLTQVWKFIQVLISIRNSLLKTSCDLAAVTWPTSKRVGGKNSRQDRSFQLPPGVELF